MLRNRLYYRIKPFLPAFMRLGVRRWFAVRKRERVRHIWPIMPGSEKHPPGWCGWPEGKRFGLVLTHDVESQSGVDRCMRLMELERRIGFRSSFNFIPENSHRIPDELLEGLKQNGFEVGVHDLHHDGKLYWSRKQFTNNAKRINRYVREWGASGFRSGFMLHNLEWLHELDVDYDSSTFDTDPFEPQPDGVGTIFPFWVPKPAETERGLKTDDGKPMYEAGNQAGDLPGPQRAGYVELPYTLPQDSTLFLVFRERNADIWFQKLDWIARHGGMALLVTHPDYMGFAGEKNSRTQYSVKQYEEFLSFILQRYKDQYWHALPKDVVRFYANTR